MALGRNAVRILFLVMVVCAAQAGKPAPKEKEEKGKEKSGASAPEAAAGPEGAAEASGPGGSFDISKLGAKGDGKTDSTKALTEAWASACAKTGAQKILIPKGDYLTGALNFTGPCKASSITFQVDGNLLGSTDLSQFKGNWIEIMRVDNLVITGKGKLDGQGPSVWSKNACAKKYDCKTLPNSLVLDFCNNATIEGITLLNAKFFHMNIFECKGVTVKDVTVTAPGESPNTDGIHMGDSSQVTITGTNIGTGDDCISIGPGTSGVNITGVTCGPGHGISIGSLGRYKDEKDVTDITVKDCTLKKTTNGVRIKSYEDAASVLTASKIHYENIQMDDVANPVIIDMKYCPNKICTSNGGSKVTIKDVTFKNITGTSSTPEAVSLLCSEKIPCSGVTMADVKVEYKGTNNKTMAVCNNAKGSATGCLKELACL
ncbi:exopolygalacturonase-like [Phragmites australis]|uniref:exopolygalacturonase-like n=1 Tax=Phragmites australis TaxID=29695 RepID=UPI002D78A5BF|nr:exopolygalacturonase-like [Phragmites australis]